MNLQWLVVGVVVAVSALSAAWTLMPASLRRSLANAALALPLPALLANWLRRQATSDASCACSGCDRNPQADSATAASTTTASVRPITIHRRLPR